MSFARPGGRAPMDSVLSIPEAPLKERLNPAIHVEPKDRERASEDARQIAFVNRIKRDAPHIAVHAVPNGGRQSDWARVHGHRMGVYTGWPDTGLDWLGGSAMIEFKDGDGRPDQAQIACLNRLHRLGKHVAICRTARGAINWLRSIGAPVPEFRG